MRDGQLGCADGMGEIYVEAGVAVGCGTVIRRDFAGWMPETGEGLWKSVFEFTPYIQ